MLIRAEKIVVRIVYLLWSIEIFFLSNYNQKTSEEMISFFQQYCRQNYDDFYSLFLFLKSLAAIEKERLNLENKLKNMLEQWNANTKI